MLSWRGGKATRNSTLQLSRGLCNGGKSIGYVYIYNMGQFVCCALKPSLTVHLLLNQNLSQHLPHHTDCRYDARRDAVKVKWLDGDTRFPTVRPYEMFGCRASNAPQNLMPLPHDKIAPNPGYKILLSTSGGTKSCSSKSLIFTLEWPAVHDLDQCAALCYRDRKCTYIFFQMVNRGRPGGLLCQGFSTCDVGGRLSPKVGGYGETFHVATTGTRARPSPAASFWSESAQDDCSRTGCRLEWIKDGECQTICSGLECMNDGGDCKSEGTMSGCPVC